VRNYATDNPSHLGNYVTADNKRLTVGSAVETVNGHSEAELICGPTRTGPWKPSKMSNWPPSVGSVA